MPCRRRHYELLALFSSVLLFPFPSVAANIADFSVPTLDTGDAVLDAMFRESIEVAIESIQTDADGRRYMSAGPKYSIPSRTYYRDSYWTAGMLLLIDPSIVREQILRLAGGIEQDGSVPSALTVDTGGLKIPLWIDHHDSGPFFIMMVFDYIRWTGDTSVMNEFIGGRSVFSAMEDVLTHLFVLDTDGNLLPEKPSGSLQDWLDTIPRGGEVLYNQVLYYRALRNMVELSALRDYDAHATVFHRHSLLVRHQINARFWDDVKGYYLERCENGLCVDRLTNESSLAALYEVVTPANRARFLRSLERLQTDWGVINAIPAYEGFRLSSYQNATDWPVLDGMNAGARLKHGDAGWRHPLTGWWIYFDRVRSPGEMLPEYISPDDFSGGRSQAWSVNPMVSFVRYGIGLDPALDGSYAVKPSPRGLGNITLSNVPVRGHRLTVKTRARN